MGIFAKQGPYQEFKDLFVKEFDADKTVDRLNKVEDELNANKELIKRSEALDRETGKVDTVMSKYQQGLNAVVNNANASLWDKKNAAKQLATSYANDPERVALAKSKQALDESIKVNAGKADTSKAAKYAQLVHDANGGTKVDANGNISTLQSFSVPKDFDANTTVNQIGSGFETNGISWEADPETGVEGYWQTTTTGNKIRLAGDISSVAKSNIYSDADTIKHFELDNFDKLHDQYTTLYLEKGMSQQEAERNATRTILNKPVTQNANGETVQGSSILQQAVDKNVTALADAAATKFKTKYTERKLDQFQEAKGEGAGTDTSNLPLDTTERPVEKTPTQGVPVLDPEGAITEENYKSYNKDMNKANKIKTSISKNIHAKSLLPDIEKIALLPTNSDEATKAYSKAMTSLHQKIVGEVPKNVSKLSKVQLAIYDGKMQQYTEAARQLGEYYTSVANNIPYVKAINEAKHVLSTNYGVDKEHIPKTFEGMQKMISTINEGKKNIIQTQMVPSVEANDNMTQSVSQTLGVGDVASNKTGGDDMNITDALDKGSYVDKDNNSISSITDLKIAMAKPQSGVSVSGLSFIKNKSLTESKAKLVLNINGQPLYINPSNNLITALEPFAVLDLQKHRADLAASAKPVTITTEDGKQMNVKIKFKNLIPYLYNTDTKKPVDNGMVVLKKASDATIKAHSSFTGESVSDGINVVNKYTIK